MSNRMTLAILSLVAVSLAVGCGSSKVFVREGAEPIDMETEKMLILPCDAWGFGSAGLDETEMSVALFGGCIKEFGANGISLEPAKPAFEAAGLSGMARRLGWGVYHMIDFHKSYDLSTDSCGEGIEEVPVAVAQLVTLAAEKLGLDFKPRYIFALALNGLGSGTVPGTMKYRVIGTIYDLEMKLVHSCTYYTNTMPADKGPAMAKVVTIPGECFNKIMEVAAKKQEAAAEAAEGDGGEGQ